MAGEMTEERRAKQSESMRRKWAERKAAKAEQAEDTGRPDGKRFDPPPKTGEVKPKPKKRGPHKKPSDEQLTDVLGKLFTFPAIPAKMVLECDFCAAHFATEGPKTAHELVQLSKEHPQLRGTLEDMYRAYTSVTWVGIIAGYLARPIAHHLAPPAFLEYSYPVLGVPPRQPKPRPSSNGNGAGHVHDPMTPPEDMLRQSQELWATMNETERDAAREQMAALGVDVDAIMGSDAAADTSPEDQPEHTGPVAADADPQPGE